VHVYCLCERVFNGTQRVFESLFAKIRCRYSLSLRLIQFKRHYEDHIAPVFIHADLSKLQIQDVKCTVDARDHERLAILLNTQVKLDQGTQCSRREGLG